MLDQIVSYEVSSSPLLASLTNWNPLMVYFWKVQEILHPDLSFFFLFFFLNKLSFRFNSMPGSNIVFSFSLVA